MSLNKIQELGILVEPAAAALFEAAEPDRQARALEKLEKMEAKPLVLNADLIKKLMLPEAKLIKKTAKPPELGINDYAAAWSARFAALQQILLKKPEMAGAVSIAGAKGDSAVIGQVNKNESRTELEDPTGSVELITDQPLLADDVVGVVGRFESGKVRAEKIIFPDIPLRVPITATGLIGINHEADSVINFPRQVIENGAISNGTQWWQIDNMIALVHKTDWNALASRLGVNTDQAPLELLRRHHLCAPPWDFMEPVPDIFIAFASSDTKTESCNPHGLAAQPINYKGTTIIWVLESAVIDLATREAQRT